MDRHELKKLASEEREKERQRLEVERDEIRARKTLLETRPQDFVAERLSRINASIARRKNPRTVPSKPGNKTMYQHLLELKDECEKRPEVVVSRELDRVRAKEIIVEDSLTKEIDEGRYYYNAH